MDGIIDVYKKGIVDGKALQVAQSSLNIQVIITYLEQRIKDDPENTQLNNLIRNQIEVLTIVMGAI